MPEQASVPASSVPDGQAETPPPPTIEPAVSEPAAGPRPRKPSTRTRKGAPPPVLVEVHRGDTIESRHRGHIVVVAADGAVERAVGAYNTPLMLRSTVKPFGVLALIESGAADDLELTTGEIAIMCASHTGEDKHVRTLQAIFRRAGVSQTLLQCGAEGAPTDRKTAARLARDGETPGPVRHGCSGFHASSILLSAYAGWTLEDYIEPAHPSQVAVRKIVTAILGRKPGTLKTAVDNCGVLTYEATVLELARAYLLLADPEGPNVDQARARFAPALRRVRDAMMAAPEMVGGTFDNLDTELMHRRPGGLVSKAGADGMRAVGLVATERTPARAVALKIEDGDLSRRAVRAASVETMAQIGVLDERDLRALEDDHHPTVRSPQGGEAVTAAPRFELPRLDGSA